MSSIKEYAKEVFEELNKCKSKNAYQLFQKELIKLHDEQEKHTNDVGCAISQDCSMMGLLSVYYLRFPRKETVTNKKTGCVAPR